MAQVTGSTSSYARKYALNGLFAIDDTRDPDTQDNNSGQGKKKQGNQKQAPKSATKKEQNKDEQFKTFINRYYSIMRDKFDKTNEEITELVEQILGKPARQAPEKDVAEAVKKIYMLLQKKQAESMRVDNTEKVQTVLDGVFPTRV